MRIPTLLLSAVLLIPVAGCGDDAAEPGVTASFNGTEFAATDFQAAYYPEQRSHDGGNRPERPAEGLEALTGRFQLIAQAGDREGNGFEPQREIALTVSGITGPGTYPIVRGNADIESFQLYAKDYTAEPVEYYAPVGDEPVGTLIIDELGPDAVGSFTFTIPSADGQVAEVTDGKFRVKGVTSGEVTSNE